MPRDAGGGESREQRGESGRLDDWQRIEAEKPERDRARKQWDATHEPSEEFERAARPLGDEYGRDRPRHRELTPEQRAELEAFTGRSADEVLALREKDPRAEHNRDEAGRIRDTRPDSESSADGRDQPGPTDAGEPTAPPAADSAGGAGGPVDDPPTAKGADDAGGDKGGGDGNEDRDDDQPEHRDRADRHERDDQGERGGTWVRVGFDEHGNLDWSTARYENGEPYDPSDFPEPSDVSESSDKDADADASTEQASDADETVARESSEAVSTASDESDQWDLETRLGDHPDAPPCVKS